MGFVDTDEGIRFSSAGVGMGMEYDVGEITPSLSKLELAQPRIVSPVEFIVENDESNYPTLVSMEDRGLVQDHVFLAFAQMVPAILTDKKGAWKDRTCGEIGLKCRHCEGRCVAKGESRGLWFPRSVTTLGQTTTMNSIIK